MDRSRRWLILFLAIVHLWSFPYFGALRHANELPRVLTTQELVHRRTFELDGRLDELGSKADIATTPDGRHYQNKSPGLSILGVVVYAPVALVYWVFGSRPSLLVTTWLLRVVLVTSPAVLFLFLFRRFAELFAGEDKLARDGAFLAYALGSMGFSYALVFMSHIPATVAVGSAFILASEVTRGRARSARRTGLFIGLLLGVGMFVEYQAIFAAFFIAVFVLVRGPERKRVFPAMAVGLVPWLAILALYHWSSFGSPFRTGYAYSVDAANRVGFLGIVGPSSTALSQLLAYGNNGLLVLSPWVFLAFVGAWGIARDADTRQRAGPETIVALAIALSYLLFVASLEPEFGRAGWSVGPRYLAVAMPFFAWLAAAGIVVCSEYAALLVPALSTVLVGIVINVIAATTYPHWPTEFVNPLYEVSLRLLDEGRAPRSIGTLLGFHGVASVAPLYVAVLCFSIGLLHRAGAKRAHLAIACVLSFMAIYRLHDFAKTKQPVASNTWNVVVSTYEP